MDAPQAPPYVEMNKSFDFPDGVTVAISLDCLKLNRGDQWRFNLLILWAERDESDRHKLRKSDWICYRETYEEAHKSVASSKLPKEHVGRVRRELTLLEKKSREEAAAWHAYVHKLPQPAGEGPKLPIDVATCPVPVIPDYDALIADSMRRQSAEMGAVARIYQSDREIRAQIDIASHDGLTYRLNDAWRSGWEPVAEDGHEPFSKRERDFCVALVDGVVPSKVKCVFCGHKLKLSSRQARRDHMRDVHGVENPWKQIWPKPRD